MVVVGAQGVVVALVRNEGVDDGLVAALDDGGAGDGAAVVVEDHFEFVAEFRAGDDKAVG